MNKYVIISNDYFESLTIAENIEMILQNNNFVKDIVNPDYVFIIGGDGTLLKAVNEFQDIIDEVCFIPIKSGALGFYFSFTANDYIQVLNKIIQDQLHLKQLPLLEIINHNDVKYALNEVKIIENTKPITTNIFVNNELLEVFKGSGLVFASNMGTTGYMRSINAAVICTNIKLFEMKEIAPVKHHQFYTIDTPLIFDESQTVILKGDLIQKTLIIDTYEFGILTNEILIKISSKTLNIAYNEQQNNSVIKRLNQMFTKS